MSDSAFAEEVGPPGGLARLSFGTTDRQGREVKLLGLAEHVSATRARPQDGEGGGIGGGALSDAYD